MDVSSRSHMDRCQADMFHLAIALRNPDTLSGRGFNGRASNRIRLHPFGDVRF
jgi:hypothetical protein